MTAAEEKKHFFGYHFGSNENKDIFDTDFMLLSQAQNFLFVYL